MDEPDMSLRFTNLGQQLVDGFQNIIAAEKYQFDHEYRTLMVRTMWGVPALGQVEELEALLAKQREMWFGLPERIAQRLRHAQQRLAPSLSDAVNSNVDRYIWAQVELIATHQMCHKDELLAEQRRLMNIAIGKPRVVLTSEVALVGSHTGPPHRLEMHLGI